MHDHQQPRPLGKKEFVDQVKNGVILYNPAVEGRYAVETSGSPGVTTQWKWRVLSYSLQHASFLARKPQFHHEFLTGSVKMYFDVDHDGSIITINDDEQELAFVHAFVDHVAEKTGCTNALADWAVLKRNRREGALFYEKVSYHFIYKRWVFKGPKQLGAFLRGRDVDFKAWYIDGQKYQECNLQGIGGTKRSEWTALMANGAPNSDNYRNVSPPMLVPVGVDRVADVTFTMFLEHTVQFIPVDAVRMGPWDESPMAGGPRLGPGFAPIGGGIVQDLTTMQEQLIELAMAHVMRIPGNDEASWAKDSVLFFKGGNELCVKTSFARRCAHLRPQDPPMARSGLEVWIYMAEECAVLKCECGEDGEQLVPLTEYATDCYYFATVSLREIAVHKLDRPDLPITRSVCGKRFLPDDYHTRVLGLPRWHYHPEPRGHGHFWSKEVWNLLNGQSRLFKRTEPDFYLMFAYVNLFFAEVSKKGLFIMRAMTGYEPRSVLDVKTVKMASFVYLVEEEFGQANKDGVRKTKMVEKKFYDDWMTERHGGRRCVFARPFLGQFQMPAPDFNMLAEPATNYRVCLDKWNALANDSPLKKLVAVLWKRYLHILTANESPEFRKECKQWLVRWILTKVFLPGYKVYVSVWMVGGKGTGKTTLGELMIDILGDDLALLVKDLAGFLGKQFNTSGNVPLLVFDDIDTKIKDTKTAGAWKSMVTGKKASSDNKYGANNEAMTNISDSYVTCNPDDRGLYLPDDGTRDGETGHDRRVFVQEVMSKEEQDLWFAQDGRYDCECQGNDVCNVHSFYSFADFWALFQEHIYGRDQKPGDLRDVFVGMLAEMWLTLSPDWAKGPNLQQTLPPCLAILKHQTAAISKVEFEYNKWIDRGYSCCPYGGGADEWTGPDKKMLVPIEIDPNRGGDADWLPLVSVQSLLVQYVSESGGKIDEKNFMSELNAIVRRRTNAPLKEEMHECYTWAYRRNFDTWMWTKIVMESKKVRCVRLPRARTASRSFVDQRSRLAGVDFTAELTRSLHMSVTVSQEEREELDNDYVPQLPTGKRTRVNAFVLDDEDVAQDAYALRCQAETGGEHDASSLGLEWASGEEPHRQGKKKLTRRDKHVRSFLDRAAQEVEDEEEDVDSDEERMEHERDLYRGPPPKDKEEAENEPSFSWSE